MAEAGDPLPAIDATSLAPVVGKLLGDGARTDGPWAVVPLHGGLGGQGVYRCAGRARVGNTKNSWSCVLKIAPAPRPDTNPLAWDMPQREALAYGTGFLDRLPGPLLAPRCLAVSERPDGSTWLWLEEVTDERPGQWPGERIALAARHLGRFNGAWLVAETLPEYGWLSRGWLRRYVEAEGRAAEDFAVADDAPLLLRRCFPPQFVRRVRQLWAERDVYLTALDRLPQTICHHDAFRRNLFARRGANGAEQTVAVDWAFVGTGAVGADLAALVLGSLLFFEVLDASAEDLAENALAEYMMGLREVGWTGSERAVRLGYLATAALLYTIGPISLVVADLSDPTRDQSPEQSSGQTMNEEVMSWIELQRFQFALADEALRLLGKDHRPACDD
jgi:hypothetical protein